MHVLKSFLLLITVTVLFSGCGYEELKAGKKRTLTVVSDYLTASDSVLFSDFSKKNNINVQIIHLETDSIFNSMQSDPINVGFDLIMVSDVRILKKLQSKNLLQKFSDKFDVSQSNRFFLNTGIDPLVYYSNGNLNKDSIRYSDLSKRFWCSHIDENDLVKLFNCIKKNYKWSNRESALWLHQVEQHKMAFPQADSLDPNLIYVGLLSQFERKWQINGSLNSFQYLVFPDQNQTGLLYHFYGSGIVYQSANYSAAMDLILYLSEVSNAQRINDIKGIVSYDRVTNWGAFQKNKLVLSPRAISDVPFDLNWWKAHLSFARNLKISKKKEEPKATPIVDTLKLEN